MDEVPWFLWWDGVRLTEAELRAKLRSENPVERGNWAGRVMREARYQDVWKYLTLEDILRDWPHVLRNLGRERTFWTWLIGEWRRDGLLRS